MKKVAIGIVAILLAVSVFGIMKNKDSLIGTWLKIKDDIVKTFSKATFKKVSEEQLGGGMNKSTFQTTSKVGIDMEVSIIASESMIFGDMKKKGNKTIVVFKPKR
ncbi:MAG: hypothetical protein ABH844_01100 [Candidatus Omnitrophota bacterium]